MAEKKDEKAPKADKPAENPDAPKPEAPPKEKLYSGPIHCEGVSSHGKRVEVDIIARAAQTEEGILRSFLNHYPEAIPDSFKFEEISYDELDRRAKAKQDVTFRTADEERKIAAGLAKSDAAQVEKERAEFHQRLEERAK